jgi:hypothetical protein
MELWVGCIAGALQDDEYVTKLARAGFQDATVELWRVYRFEDARNLLAEAGLDADRLAKEVDGQIASAFIRATKPSNDSCCGPTCCQKTAEGV